MPGFHVTSVLCVLQAMQEKQFAAEHGHGDDDDDSGVKKSPSEFSCGSVEVSRPRVDDAQAVMTPKR